MELRTALEREKVRAETSDGRVRDLELIVRQVRGDNEELEEELDHTVSLLDRSKPGIDALKHENAELQGRASIMQNENSSLKRVCLVFVQLSVFVNWYFFCFYLYSRL